MKVTLSVGNTGAATWLATGTLIGDISIGGRVQGSQHWEGRAATNQPLTISPGAQSQVDATFAVPATLDGHDLVINLVSENVAWFDTCGTQSVHVPLPQ